MLNIKKCTVLHVAPEHVVQALSARGLQVLLDGQSLTVCGKVKTLGVVLDSDLTLSDHVTHCIQRALGRLRGLYRFRTLLPDAAKLQIIQSVILSIFYYCYPAYGNSISKEDMNRIQKLQNTAIRFVYDLKRFDHVSPFRDVSNLALMETACRVQTCCMIHKTLTLQEPAYLLERLQRRDQIVLRGTRHGDRLHFRRVRLEVGRRSFSYFGPDLYNDLPEYAKETVPIQRFKSKLRVFKRINTL